MLHKGLLPTAIQQISYSSYYKLLLLANLSLSTFGPRLARAPASVINAPGTNPTFRLMFHWGRSHASSSRREQRHRRRPWAAPPAAAKPNTAGPKREIRGWLRMKMEVKLFSKCYQLHKICLTKILLIKHTVYF